MSERRRLPDGSFAAEHGMCHTRIYATWCSMKERCNNPHNKSYARYGGRGIKLCPEWESDFIAFKDWAFSNGYDDTLTIDRIDVDSGYDPTNCRWVTTAQQNRNYSRNRLLTLNGVTKCLSDWADDAGVNRATLAFRLEHGMSLEEAIIPIDRRTLRWKKTTSPNFIR